MASQTKTPPAHDVRPPEFCIFGGACSAVGIFPGTAAAASADGGDGVGGDKSSVELVTERTNEKKGKKEKEAGIVDLAGKLNQAFISATMRFYTRGEEKS